MHVNEKIHNYLFNIEKDPTDSSKPFPISKIDKIVDYNGIGTTWLVYYTDLNDKDQSILVREYEYNQTKPIGHFDGNKGLIMPESYKAVLNSLSKK
jgi:hypothetical protein